ncbi:MAG: hypothetical protein OHK0046_39600 [Anaerolineae bacterium]
MSDELPEFRKLPHDKVHSFASRVFKGGTGKSSLVSLQVFEDRHYRAVFRSDYFTTQEGSTEPTKSQWNTLKKHMKRINRDVFIFKGHGEVESPYPDVRYYYIDFGFFAY